MNVSRFSRVALLLGAAFLASPTLQAWDNATVHPQVNLEALDLFLSQYGQAPKYQRARVDTRRRYVFQAVTGSGGLAFIPGLNNEASLRELPLSGLLAHGGYSADTPTSQALRHFYDPLMAGDTSQLSDSPLLAKLTGPHLADNRMDARTWALTNPDNPYRWEVALDCYRRAFAERDDTEKLVQLAKAFRAVGETMHLVADMTLPAHVRNDGHPPVPVITDNDPIEMNVGVAHVKEFARAPVDPRVQLDVPHPKMLMHHVAVFTSHHFFSKDTIADEAYGLLPHNGRPPYAQPKLDELDWDGPRRLLGTREFAGNRTRMVRLALDSYLARRQDPRAPLRYEIPDEYAADYARVLLPIAVAANARLLDLFFPKLDLTHTSAVENRSGQQLLRVGGRLVHQRDGDQVWQDREIRYEGRGWVMRRHPSGGEDVPLAAVRFADGAIVETEPLPIERAAGHVVYVQVEAGGRIFTSAPETIAKAETPKPKPPPPPDTRPPETTRPDAPSSSDEFARVEISPSLQKAKPFQQLTFTPRLYGIPADRIFAVRWDFGDGEAYEILHTNPVKRTYRFARTYLVRMTVTVKRGALQDRYQATAKVIVEP